MFILLAIPCILLLLLLAIVAGVMRRWKVALLFLVAGIGLNVATEQIPLNIFRRPAKPQGTRVKILEYNICAKAAYQALHDDAFIAYILAQDADILFLPENLYYTDCRLDSVLSQHYPYSIYRQVPKKERPEEMGIYSRFPLTGIKRLPSPDNPNGSDTMMRAIATIGHKRVALLHLHCCSNSIGIRRAYQEREQDAALIVQSMAALRDSVDYFIAAGDFNDLSGSPLLRSLQEQGLHDAWWTAGTGFGFTYREGWHHFRLDHILVSDAITVTDIHVDGTAPYSDHLPLVVTVRVLE